MLKSDSLFQVIEKGMSNKKNQDLLYEELENRFTETCAVLVLDSTGFTKTTQSEGIVFYLSIISKLRKIGEKIFKKNHAVSYRGHADNLYAEFKDVDSAVQAACSLHRFFKENPIELGSIKNTFGVCIGIGYGKVLRSEHDGVFGNEMNLASIYLANLLGLTNDKDIVPSETLNDPILPSLSSPIKISQIMRPERDISQSMITAADYIMKIKRANYFPDIGTFVGYTGGKPNRDLFTGLYNAQIVIGAGLEWSLNLGSRTEHNIQSAKSDKLSAEFEKQRLDDLLILQAETARENLIHSFNSWEMYNREFNITRQKYRLAKIRSQEGELSVNRLLEMEAELTAAEELSKVSNINYYLKYTDYIYAIGSDEINGGL